MALVDARVTLWEALAGRAPGQPTGPADSGLWSAVVERINPAKARPRLRPGIEEASLVSARGVPYVMLRSPDRAACYLRLTPQEWALAGLMDGRRTLARLVAEFARISGRLAPEQVRRVVADLAGNRMLEELPVDAFRPLTRVRRRPWPVRLGQGLLAIARGRRMLVVNVDPLAGLLYRAGGRLLFTRPAAVLLALVAVTGLAAFGWSWWQGAESLFLTGGSYPAGVAVLLACNVVALACHELGHALAAKHAGRQVPSGGVLVYFGIPSVFVDTTDVWMAGRRARLLTTAAGPAAGLVLAGTAALIGLAVPELGGWTFKLAFVWYFNSLINLNPFLALDGYYLLMDWLEVPNLRARGLAWIRARLRPRWAELDTEGRLVALYGMLAVLWLVIAANIAYRIYVDRVAGLVTGVWRSGWGGKLLLVAVVAGLAAPVLYALAGWVARRVRAVRRWYRERQVAADLPRRREVLLTSPLAQLPGPELDRLAGYARWRHPRPGELLARAGRAQRDVLVVAAGAVEGRRPGDPGGIIRQRVGPGGVIGLATALTGATATLNWHTAGTTLLAVPASLVATSMAAVAPAAGADPAQVRELLAQTPGLSGLAEDERAALATQAVPVTAEPGSPIEMPDPSLAYIVESGVVQAADGELGRGSVLLAPADPPGYRPPRFVARSWVRLWALPVVSLAAPAGQAGPAGEAPRYGVHPPAAYPPLASPPGPPPAGVDRTRDRWFERRMRWLVLLLLLLAVLLTGAQLVSGPSWSEMPEDQVLLSVEEGLVTVAGEAGTPAGGEAGLRPGERRYLSAGDRVEVGPAARARLTLRGGSAILLCPGSVVEITKVDSRGTRPITATGELSLAAGTVLVDTATSSQVFEPAQVSVQTLRRGVVNRGEAWYAVDPLGVRVGLGEVTAGGTPVPPSQDPVDCGDGRPVERPTAPAIPAVPSPSGTPEPTPTATPTPTPTVAAPGTAGPPAPAPTPAPSPPAAQLPPPPPPPPPPPGPDRQPPVFASVGSEDSLLYQVFSTGNRCLGGSDAVTTTQVYALIDDPTDSPLDLDVSMSYEIVDDQGVRRPGGSLSVIQGNQGLFRATLGPFQYGFVPQGGGTIEVTMVVTDPAGNSAQTTVTVELYLCVTIR